MSTNLAQSQNLAAGAHLGGSVNLARSRNLAESIRRLAFNGYPESIPGATYSGGSVAIKEAVTNKLISSPANVVPTGGRWDAANNRWVDTHSAGKPLHPFRVVKTPKDPVKEYVDYPAWTALTQYAVGDKVSIDSGDVELYMTCQSADTSHATAPVVNAAAIGTIISEEVADTHVVATGTVVAGTESLPFANAQVDDANLWKITEVVGANPLLVRGTVAGLSPAAYKLTFRNLLYSGNPAHVVRVSLLNKNTGVYDSFAVLTDGVTQDLELTLSDTYIDNGVVSFQIEHETPGAAGHYLQMDYIFADDYADGITWRVEGYHTLRNRYRNLGAVTNKCLADYPRPYDGSELASGSPTVNKRYRISAQSIVDFTTIGAANNVVGTEFVATGSGVTLSAVDKLIPIVDGLGTKTYHNGSSFIQNITNLTIISNGDPVATGTVVSVSSSDLEAAIDESGGSVIQTSFLDQFEGGYLGYYFDNSGATLATEFVFSGPTGNTNPHTVSIFAKGSGSLSLRSSPSIAFNTAVLTRVVKANNTPIDSGRLLQITLAPGESCLVLVPNLTETSAVMPLMEANKTRAGNVLNAPWPSSVTGSKFALHLEATPSAAGQSATLASSYSDSDNYIEVYTDADNLYFNKRIGGVDHIASVAYTHAAGEKFEAKCYFDTVTGSGIRYRVSGGVWSDYGTQADTTAAVLVDTLSTGHKNQIGQFNGHVAPVQVFTEKTLMEAA